MIVTKYPQIVSKNKNIFLCKKVIYIFCIKPIMIICKGWVTVTIGFLSAYIIHVSKLEELFWETLWINPEYQTVRHAENDSFGCENNSFKKVDRIKPSPNIWFVGGNLKDRGHRLPRPSVTSWPGWSPVQR